MVLTMWRPRLDCALLLIKDFEHMSPSANNAVEAPFLAIIFVCLFFFLKKARQLPCILCTSVLAIMFIYIFLHTTKAEQTFA